MTELSGNQVRFTLQGNASFTYVVTASSTAGSYDFSGMLRDSDGDDHAVGGQSSVTVGSPDDATDAPVKVVADPKSPGAAAEYTITFKTEAVLRAGTDRITLNIDSSIGVPTSLAPSAVRIRADHIDGAANARPNQNRALDLAPVYRVIPGTDGRKEYKIRIPNMDGVPENPVADIAAGATVTLTLLANSGFTNPTEANVVVLNDDGTRKSGGDDFKVSTSAQTEGVSAYISTPLELFSDDKADNRNKPLTITGKGFKNGVTVIVYLDKNKNDMRDAGDVDLDSEVVGSNDAFESTFNVTVPPFEAGEGNRIHATDGENPPNATGADDGVEFEVEGLVRVNPRSVSVGDNLQISVVDWPDSPINSVTIAGKEQLMTGEMPSVSNGSADFEIMVGNDVPSGTQQVRVASAGENDTTNVVISGADLTVTPVMVVPNQSITTVGRGFGERAMINTGTTGDTSMVTLGGDDYLLGVGNANFNNGQGVTTDSGGNWNANIVVPITSATTTPGSHILEVIDSSGRGGSATVQIAERVITLDPPAARPGETVTVTGTGFPASTNRAGAQSAPPVSIAYDETSRVVATVTPDASGNIEGSFRVPLSATIPSTNTVTVSFSYRGEGNQTPTVNTTTIHEVPGAGIELSASEGKPGMTLTVTGAGFKAFQSITKLDIGGVDVVPSPKPATDSSGKFTTSILVPDLDVGTHSVEAQFGGGEGTVASAIFKILEAGDGAMMPEVMMAEAATPDVAFAAVIAEDNLITVYHFDPATQSEAPNFGWTLYDARPLFMGGNNLDMVNPGGFYFVEVSENQMDVSLGGRTMDLYAGLNPIVW